MLFGLGILQRYDYTLVEWWAIYIGQRKVKHIVNALRSFALYSSRPSKCATVNCMMNGQEPFISQNMTNV